MTSEIYHSILGLPFDNTLFQFLEHRLLFLIILPKSKLQRRIPWSNTLKPETKEGNTQNTCGNQDNGYPLESLRNGS